VLTGLLDRSALYDVLAEIEGFSLGRSRSPSSPGLRITRIRWHRLTAMAA